MVNKHKLQNSSRYYPPELTPVILCAACLGVVLQEDKQAKELFGEIVACYKLHGFQEIYEKLTEELPEGEILLKKIIDISGFEYNQPPEVESAGIPQMRKILNGVADLVNIYTQEYIPWIKEGKARNRDMKLLLHKIKELIEIGFNNRKEQAKEIYRVSGSKSYWLGFTINLSALFENYKLILKEWERLRVMKVGGKIYNINDVITDQVTNRVHRNLTKQYKSAGFFLVHDEILENMARKWYQCRVVYSGPEEYCRQMQLRGEKLVDSNISNDIRVCDEILGYPRRSKENK